VSHHLLVDVKLAVAELVAMNRAVAELAANQVCLVAHPEVSVVASVVLVVASAHLRLALGPQVEPAVVAKAESVEQVQVALLGQRS
jgi:hypothetical protein